MDSASAIVDDLFASSFRPLRRVLTVDVETNCWRRDAELQ